MKGVQFVSIKEFETRENEGLVERIGEETIQESHWSQEQMGRDYFKWLQEKITCYSADVVGEPIGSSNNRVYLFGKTTQEQERGMSLRNF